MLEAWPYWTMTTARNGAKGGETKSRAMTAVPLNTTVREVEGFS
jgi:hypothetical protein